MSRVLVLGGYGGFGARISRRLAAAGYEVLVSGRSVRRAQDFCRSLPGTVPLEFDRADIAAALKEVRPWLVVDASGPFQAMNYAVPQACIAAGVHYCDIADGRSFVSGIDALDETAREAGVCVISGASSVPALSGAIVRSLAQGAECVTAVEIAISASNRATAGPSVSAAILGQVGQPFTRFEAGRWTEVLGWQKLVREDFSACGVPPVRGRLVGDCDVPDLALLPERLPGRPAVIFRAGTELGFQNRALKAAAWLVRKRLLVRILRFAPVLERFQRLTARLGTDRSAMIVRLFGLVGGRRVERRFTLIADRGDGPEIPALAVPLIANRIRSLAEQPGARDAGQSLAMEDFAPAFANLAITTETLEIEQSDPLYRRVMKADFDLLPASLRDVHSILRNGGATGEAVVEGAETRLGALIARAMGFPPAGRHQVHVQFDESANSELWTRDFGGHRFTSELSEVEGQLQERFGPLRFRFELPRTEGGLAMRLVGWSAFDVPLPLCLAPRSPAIEWDEGGRFHFDVPITAPGVGRLVHYRGWLRRS